MRFDGKALTEAIINARGFRDSENRTHVAHGIFTFSAAWYAHVCFDHHSVLGRRCWWISIIDLQLYILARGLQPCGNGTAKGSEIRNTGSGYKLSPSVAKFHQFQIDDFVRGLKEDDIGAVGLVRRWLESNGQRYRAATRDEQRAGIDLVALSNNTGDWEVKCRSHPWPDIFVQLGETNPYKKSAMSPATGEVAA